MTGLRRAFTLVELLIVVVIIVVVSAITVPAYARFWARTQFTAAVGQVQDLLGWAREQAVAFDANVLVTYAPQSATFSAKVAQTPVPKAGDRPVVMTTEPGTSPVTPRGLTLSNSVHVEEMTSATGEGGAIRFRSDGTCVPARIRLLSEDGYTASIELLAGSGRAVARIETAGSEP